MTPPTVARKIAATHSPPAIPKGMHLPDEKIVLPQRTLFGILQTYRDEAINKNPKSYLANYTVDSLVFSVQKYRASHPIEILTENGKVPLKEENKYNSKGQLKKVQENELLKLKEALSENNLKKLHLKLTQENWELSDIWVNPDKRPTLLEPKKAVATTAKLPPKPSIKGAEPKSAMHAKPKDSPERKSVSPKINQQPSWFDPPPELVKFVTVQSLKNVEAWRAEVALEHRKLSADKRLGPFVIPIDKVLGVIHRESKGDPEITGDFDKKTGLPRSFGLTQMQVRTASKYFSGINSDNLLNPTTNIAVALRELAEMHRTAANGNPKNISEVTINTAICAHNVGEGWLYKEEFSAARRAKLERKVANYLQEVDFVAERLNYVGASTVASVRTSAEKNKANP